MKSKHAQEAALGETFSSEKRQLLKRLRDLEEENARLKSLIASRDRMEKGLKESERNFRALAELSPAAIFVYQGERIIYANPAAEQTTGYSQEVFRHMKFWELFAPEFQPLIRKRMISRQRGEPLPSRYEARYLTRDGQERWAEIYARLIKYGGKPAVLAKTFDITERKAAEKALKKSQYILAKSQQMAHVGNWAWNLKTDELNWSDEGFRIFGYEPGEVQPTLPWLLGRVHPEDREMIIQFTEAVRRGERLGSIDYRIGRPDGSVRYVNSLADKLARDRAGEPAWVYGINQDITDRKRVEKALEEAKARAELYLDLMSHDINNLNQIGIGFLELALNALPLDDASRELIEKPMEALYSSSALIGNLRKIQQARAGSLGRQRVDVAGMLRRLTPRYSCVAGRQIKLELSGDGCCVLANDLLEDAFGNIIDNAVKHSAGPLKVGIRLSRARRQGQDYCRVAIEDNGPGIPDEIKPQLFQRLAGKRGGHGLGLYLVRTLIEDFGGRVEVEDRVKGDCKKGSRFNVWLPAA